MKGLKVAVVGATGLVGRTMLSCLDRSNILINKLIAVASEASAGKKIMFRGKECEVIVPGQAVGLNPDIALFSAGASVSREWASVFANGGTFVIDNSSAWRMEKDIPLVVPEINPHTLKRSTKIIANPNCSTIQMVMALAPLHAEYVIKRIVVSTYQSVTGTGIKAVRQLESELSGASDIEKVYPHRIFNNCLPHCDVFLESGYTREEMKLVNETRKILETPDMAITATAVRVPVTGGHSESVNVQFGKNFSLARIRELLAAFPGITVADDPANNIYPMPLQSEGKDDVFVGRIRRDMSCDNSLNMWIVSDNLRKGAATNAVQIAELLAEKGLVG